MRLFYALARRGIIEILFPIQKEYNVDDAYKKINLKKVAKSFREFKHRLRVKYYDKYDNDVDRKRNCPTGVKLEEWEKFVDNESKPSRKLMRTKGKTAREAVKALHTSGRRGAARTVHDMKSKNPNVKVTRTDSYMAIHTHKDGSFIAPERMTMIQLLKCVALDKFGRVFGYECWHIKDIPCIIGSAKEQLCQQKQQHSMLEERFGSLERQMVTITKILLETREEVAGQQSHRRIVADSSATSNARDPTRSQSHGDSSRGMELCELINMHREVVAKGRATRANIILDATLDTPMDIYNVRVCLVIDRTERLFGSKRTFGELHLPTKAIKWRRILLVFSLGTVFYLSVLSFLYFLSLLLVFVTSFSFSRNSLLVSSSLSLNLTLYK
ncbi:hypothetical protein IFM89_038978 [Coptis chinensis]|uniref:Transposase n=1 Tax=Coptis chinensis TaxID=261450 RepID=A0A835HIB6_9MAGN|nr:hypothetical protein IFM89_038978 [Coptis chinensis]